jgi:hypothetical protein
VELQRQRGHVEPRDLHRGDVLTVSTTMLTKSTFQWRPLWPPLAFLGIQ